MGTIEALWVKRAHRGVMDAAPRLTLAADRGVVGSADQGGKRQITIIAAETWERLMRETGATLPPVTRRANVLVRGLDLAASRGRILRLGECRVRIAGETKPCERMDEAHDGLQAAMRADWGGGAFAVILDDGEIAVGDDARWEDGPADAVTSAVGAAERAT